MELTREDLREVARDIKADLGQRIERVEDEMRRTRETVEQHGLQLNEYKVRTSVLEKAVFNGRRPVSEDERPALTKRDVKVLTGLIMGVGLLVEVGHKVLAAVVGLLHR